MRRSTGSQGCSNRDQRKGTVESETFRNSNDNGPLDAARYLPWSSSHRIRNHEISNYSTYDFCPPLYLESWRDEISSAYLSSNSISNASCSNARREPRTHAFGKRSREGCVEKKKENNEPDLSAISEESRRFHRETN